MILNKLKPYRNLTTLTPINPIKGLNPTYISKSEQYLSSLDLVLFNMNIVFFIRALIDEDFTKNRVTIIEGLRMSNMLLEGCSDYANSSFTFGDKKEVIDCLGMC